MTRSDRAELPLIIFDVDGTLVGGESYDWSAFGAAFEEVSGTTFAAGFFDKLTEVTASAIVRAALPQLNETALAHTIIRVAHGYAQRLAVDIAAHPAAFQPTPGALELLRELSARGYNCAIATGDWFESIKLKLNAAQIPWHPLPIATSSDRPTRAETIALAAERSGRAVSQSIYIGDGTWDLRATQSLRIPFIGVGAKHPALASAGAEHVFPTLEPAGILPLLDQIRANRRVPTL
ncbi:HAD family hydrolase [Synoicihabitans lomoniglobus]|uniref:phosphoglycolate phosphatase n=1 Tax=Synoicihabitans lomoniglobus TaxID=2909285 RepID=A0AAF0CTC2_9BACT|nr:HAD hydrolase-like protein [Opitutaceae bacterium LMO-M01]WED67521.1 HAD hydrolase-like protein [Opitutaceae bacterium LMO-M01]